MEFSFLTLTIQDKILGACGSLCSIIVIDKNKRLIEGGEKGVKKKVVDPYSKLDWNDVKALNIFSIRHTGKTLVTRTLEAKLHQMASRVMRLK